MSFRRNRQLKQYTVILTGMGDKSQIFQAAFNLFPSLNNRDDISGNDGSGDEMNINEFFYEGKPPHDDLQVQLKDVMNIESPSYMELTTEYRCAHCILLIYDPTVEGSLQTICEHYEHMILNMGLNVKIILIRNNANTSKDKVLISKVSESKTLETSHSGQLLNEMLEQSYNGVDVFLIYDLLTPGVKDDVSRFFLKDLLEILKGCQTSASSGKSQCRRRKTFCCCLPRRKKRDDGYEPFVQA